MRLNIGKTGLRSEIWVRILFDAYVFKSANVVNLPLYQYTGELPFWFAEQVVAPLLRRVAVFVKWSPSVLHSCVSNDSYSFPTGSCPAPGYPLPSFLTQLGESAVFHLSELGWSPDPSWEKLGAFSILIAKGRCESEVANCMSPALRKKIDR